MSRRRKKRSGIPGFMAAVIIILLLIASFQTRDAEKNINRYALEKDVVSEEIATDGSADIALSEASYSSHKSAAVSDTELSDTVVSDGHESDSPDDGRTSIDTELLERVIPAYSGEMTIKINDDLPYFNKTDLEYAGTQEGYELSDLDSLGRCGTATGFLTTNTMTDEDREDISSVYPTGWEQNKYDFVDGGWLYNRSHLLAHMLTGINAEPKALITGTRSFNVDGMLPIESTVASYIQYSQGKVLYRVTPYFEGENLLATGVLMEAESVEDKGVGLTICKFVYNVQDGVEIDYATGDNRAA